MKYWVMTKIYDDGDPGDHASLQEVRILSSVDAVRAAFKELGDMYPFVFEEDFPEAEDWDEITNKCRETPEQYGWADSPTGDDTGWDGGYIVDFTEVEVGE